MKKILALSLALTMSVGAVGALAACGRKEDETLDGVTFVERTGEIYKDTMENKTPIKLSFTPGFGMDWAKQMARGFLLDDAGKDYYMILDSDSELTTAVASKLQAGVNLSDIYFPLASSWQSYAASGQLEPLDDLYNMQIPGEDKKVGEKIRGTWETYGKFSSSSGEHFYVFPGNENVTGIVYNKTLFDEHNWTVPTTVDEFKTLCDNIVEAGIAPIVYPGKVNGGYWDFVCMNWWLQVSGTAKLDEFMRFDSPEVFNPTPETSPSYGKQKMLEQFENLIAKNKTTYTLAASSSKDHLTAPISFIQRQAAMIPNGNWIEKESLEEMTDEYRMMNVPFMTDALKDENGKPIAVNYPGQPDYLLIPAKAEHKEGAKQFLAFICRDDMLKLYTEQTGTARPFTYDVTGCNVSEFAKSCLDIWQNSKIWFEASTSKLWTAAKIRRFNSVDPYGGILGGTTTAAAWCTGEYETVTNSWSDLLQQVS